MSTFCLKIGLAILLINLFSCRNTALYDDQHGFKPQNDFEKALGIYAQGLLHFQDNPKKSLELLKDALLANPYEPLIINDYSTCLQKKINRESSLDSNVSEFQILHQTLVSTFSEALKLHPDATYLRLNLVKTHIALEQYDDALKLIRDCQNQKEDRSLYLAKIHFLAATENPNLIPELNRSISTSYLQDYDIHLLALQLFLQINPPPPQQEILPHFKIILRQLPHIPTFRDSITVTTLIDAILISSNSPTAANNQILAEIDFNHLTSQWSLLTNILLKLDMFEEAYHIVKHRLLTNSDFQQKSLPLLIRCCARLNKKNEMLSALQKLSFLQPNNPQIPPLLIKAHLNAPNGNIDEATKILESHKDEKSLNWQIIHFNVLAKMGKNEEAFVLAEKILNWHDIGQKINQINSSFATAIIPIYLKLRQEKLLEQRINQIISYLGNEPRLLNNLAYHFANHNFNLQQAESWLLKIHQNNYLTASSADTLAWILYRQERFSDAKSAIDQALQLTAKPSAEIYFHAAKIYRKLDKTHQAEQFWRELIKLNPNFKEQEPQK